MNKELLKKAIIECYQGEREIDNGDSRCNWDHRDFTEEEKSEIADEIIYEYERLLNMNINYIRQLKLSKLDINQRDELLLSAICQFTKRNTQKDIQEVENWIKTDFII